MTDILTAPRQGLVSKAALLGADIRYTVRRWVHRPGFATTVIGVLALGIAAATSVFSLVDAVLLRPLPWPAANRLVVIYAVLPERRNHPVFQTSWNRAPISWASWQALRQVSIFDEVGVWYPQRYVLGDRRTEIVDVVLTSASYLSVLGAQPSLGRLFTPDEDLSEGDAVILTHDAWHRYFGARHDVLGQTVVLAPSADSSGVVRTIVGVLPSGFRFPSESPEFVLPMGLMAWNGRFETNRFLRAAGRLSEGVSIDRAVSVAEPLIRRDESPNRRSARLMPIADDQLGQAARPLWLIFAGAGLLLLLACANVAGLLVGELRARRTELAIRAALGGSRSRVLQLLAVEHLLLAHAAGALGVFVASWLTRALVVLAPERVPGLDNAHVDLRVLTFAVAVCLGTAVLFGLGPAWVFSATPTNAGLSSERETTLRATGHRVIVAFGFALALPLLVCASLFAETMFRLRSRPLGFETSRLAVATIRPTVYPRIELPDDRNVLTGQGPIDRARRQFTQQLESGWVHTAALIDHLSALPGVVDVAGVGAAPFTGGTNSARIRLYGQPLDEEQSVQRQAVTEQYFRAMRLEVLRGRAFTALDRQGGFGAVVSEELERRFFGGQAVGKRLVHGSTVYDVIGVVPNVKQYELSDNDLATLYVLNRTVAEVNQLIVRTSIEAAAVLPLVRQTIRDYDPRTIVVATATMDDLLSASIAEERFRARIAAVFGVAALLLAAIGLYGLAARSTAERRREIGVRMALGARPADVRSLILRDVLTIVALGCLVGLPAAYGVSQVSRSLLFGVSPTPWHAFAVPAVVLTVAAVVAAALPASRASRIDPILALRD